MLNSAIVVDPLNDFHSSFNEEAVTREALLPPMGVAIGGKLSLALRPAALAPSLSSQTVADPLFTMDRFGSEKRLNWLGRDWVSEVSNHPRKEQVR